MFRLRQKRWRLASDAEQETRAAELQAGLGCSHLMARLLANRGVATIRDAEAFLCPTYDRLADPLLLPDAGAAVERIAGALQRRERIWVHGDYDSDGVTAAALWSRLLGRLGADVRVQVPHRRRDGYDMRSPFVEEAGAAGARLIITADCGVRRVGEVEQARAAGIDVVITDHHEPGDELPRAAAVVNPHRRDSAYPFADLSGVGVAFRVGEALVRRLGHSVDTYRRAYVDLAAVGTVADVMPVLGDNRVFVKQGLTELQATRKAGLRALMQCAGLSGKPLVCRDLAFVIGPRLNAIGRLDDAKVALDLLLTRDAAEAAALAARLEQANQERREEQTRIFEEAVQQLAGRDLAETACLVLAAPDWHAGVIGIVASKLVERYCRPAVLISLDGEGGVGRGSARSIPGFDMVDAITACSEMLEEFGGHALAAGLSIDERHVEAFARRMNRLALERLTEDDLVPSVDVDAEVDSAEVTSGLLRELAALEPWGRGNEPPVLISRGVRVMEVLRIGKDQRHLKLRVDSGGPLPVDALFWKAADLADHVRPGDRLDLCYRPQLNAFNGRVNVEYEIVDLRPADLW